MPAAGMNGVYKAECGRALARRHTAPACIAGWPHGTRPGRWSMDHCSRCGIFVPAHQRSNNMSGKWMLLF